LQSQVLGIFHLFWVQCACRTRLLHTGDGFIFSKEAFTLGTILGVVVVGVLAVAIGAIAFGVVFVGVLVVGIAVFVGVLVVGIAVVVVVLALAIGALAFGALAVGIVCIGFPRDVARFVNIDSTNLVNIDSTNTVIGRELFALYICSCGRSFVCSSRWGRYWALIKSMCNLNLEC
jgi:hypothetical protein